jgi:enamine deaminase RidA (YjgF/YER057c/UK114 family)
MSNDVEGTAREAFSAILGQFLHLASVEEDDPNVEISIVIPVQEGLKHQVWLALQNRDELHFVAGHFWLEWFPCTDPARVESYINAVSGFLAGRNRILEHYRDSFCFKAQLQQPANGSWETIGTWSCLRWPSLRKTTFKQLVNA